MKALTGNINRGGALDLQDLLDAVPADQKVAILPTTDTLILYASEKELGRIPLNGVVDVSLIDDSTVRRRPTIWRFLLLGPLAFLWLKATIREAFRLCIQWKDSEGAYHFTHVPIATRIMANHMLNTVESSLTPEGRMKLDQKASKGRMMAAASAIKQHQGPVEISPFVTCGYCRMEFRKTDLPPGGKCQVCGRSLNLDV